MPGTISRGQGSGGTARLDEQPTAERGDVRAGRRQGKRSKAETTAARSAHERADVLSMAEEERLGAGTNMDEAYARNIVRLGGNFKGTEAGGKFGGSRSGFDEEEDVDARMFEDSSARGTGRLTEARQQQVAMSRALQQHKRTQAQQYWWWPMEENAALQKHLMVSLGEHAYLMMERGGAFGEGECRIVPAKRCAGCTMVDEEVYAEVDKFKRGLRRMFAAEGRGVLFIETVMGLGRLPHTHVRCVPMDEELEADAPMYFKQALDQADEEWSQHKKIISLTRERPLRHAVPPNFAYFAVEWMGGGYAHVIEDEALFKRDFGETIIEGMMGRDSMQVRLPCSDACIARPTARRPPACATDTDFAHEPPLHVCFRSVRARGGALPSKRNGSASCLSSKSSRLSIGRRNWTAVST